MHIVRHRQNERVFLRLLLENFENAAISVRESSLIIISTGNDNVSKDSKSFFTPAFLLKYCMTKVATGNSRVAEDLHCLRIDFGGSPFAVTSGGKQLPTTEGLSKGFHLFSNARVRHASQPRWYHQKLIQEQEMATLHLYSYPTASHTVSWGKFPSLQN